MKTLEAPKDLLVGEVRFYKDNTFSSESYSIFIGDYKKKRSQRLLRLNDAATYLAWNLPKGYVVTFMDSLESVDNPNKDGSYHCLSATYDCVGTGTTQAIDLCSVNMNDKISAFYIHQYDPLYGYIELFTSQGLSGPSVKIFLSQYAMNQVVPVHQWWIQDRTYSIAWHNMAEVCCVSFYDNFDGSGAKMNEILGTDTDYQFDLSKVNMQNKVSSFKWSVRGIYKQAMSSFTLSIDQSKLEKKIYQSVVEGVNAFPEEMTEVVTLDSVKETASSVTSFHEYSNGFSLSASASFNCTEAFKAEVSVNVDISKTNTSETSDTTTTTKSVSQSYTAKIPAMHSYKVSLTFVVQQASETEFTADCIRWYDFKVKDSVEDVVDGAVRYKRIEKVRGVFQGDASYELIPIAEATPLAKK